MIDPGDDKRTIERLREELDAAKMKHTMHDPPKVSIFRPHRMFLWWCIKNQNHDDPGDFATRSGVSLFGGVLVSLVPNLIFFPQYPWCLIGAPAALVLFWIGRAWLRSALHLDSPVAYRHWEKELTR